MMLVKSYNSFFQSRICCNFYQRLTFLQTVCLELKCKSKIATSACGYLISSSNPISRYFSRRAIIPGGILIAPDATEQHITHLLEKIKSSLHQKAIYIEIRNFQDYSFYKHLFEKAGFIYQAHLNYQIDLLDKQKLLAKLSETKRRQVKASEKAGLSAEISRNQEDVKRFYAILKKLYLKKVRLPLFPLEFFEKIVDSDVGKLIVVKRKDEVLGGMLCVYDEHTLYEWFVCGEEMPNQSIYPSVVATWAGIQYAAEIGCQTFDFMGAGKPGRDYGVRDFKARFGGKLVEHGRFLYICNPFLYKLGKMAIGLRKMI